MDKREKRSLQDIGKFYVIGKNLKEVKEISDVLESVELGDIDIEWEKQYLREVFSKIEVLAFKEGERQISIRPINITLEKAYINPKGGCNRKHGIRYTKTVGDAGTEFKIPVLNYELFLYHHATREYEDSDF